MNVLSLFDGCSCGQLALERASIGVNNYYASEIDKYAIQVTQSNFPDTVQLGDVKDWHSWNLPQIDLVIGGSPCQGFSMIGNQLNFDDERSSLLFHFLDVVQFYNPTYFLLENVMMREDIKNEISRLIGVEPIKINSALVSAQNRNRLYWTDIPFTGQPKDRGIHLSDILEIKGKPYVRNHGTYRPIDDKSLCIDANYHKGADNHGQRTLIRYKDTYRKLTPVECERLQTIPDEYTAQGISNTQRYKMLGNGWTVDVIAHLLKGLDNGY